MGGIVLSGTVTTTMKTRTDQAEPSPIRVPKETLKRMSEVFKLLADQSRLKIVLALAPDRELHVSALCELLGQSQPAVSHHLTLMRMAGLVEVDRKGKFSFYRLSSDHIGDLIEQFFSDSGNASRQLQFEDFALAFKRK